MFEDAGDGNLAQDGGWPAGGGVRNCAWEGVPVALFPLVDCFLCESNLALSEQARNTHTWGSLVFHI